MMATQGEIMKRSVLRVLAPVALLALVGAVVGRRTTPGRRPHGSHRLNEVQAGDSILDSVIANDVVRCGARRLPGFSILDEAGEHVGFDADFCRVIAAAVLGDSTKVEFVDVETDAGSPPCSPARSTCSCATRRGRRAGTAPRVSRSCTRRSTTARG